MTTATVPAHGTQGVGEPVAQPGRPRPRGSFATAIRDALRRPAILIALGWVVLVVVSSVLAGVLAPHDPLAQDLAHRLAGRPAPTGWAPTRWAATCFAGSSPPAACRCSSALMLVVAFGIGLPLALIAAERGRPGRAGHSAGSEVTVLFAMPR